MKKSALFFVAALLIAEAAAPQDALTAAKDLYASAAYEDALAALTRVKESAPELAQQADEYAPFPCSRSAARQKLKPLWKA
jgi:hypothetical protein